MLRSTFLPTALFLLAASHAPCQDTTHFVWALDAGVQTSPTPILRIYQPDGEVFTTVSVPGSSSARALGFDAAGRCFVCRGNQVRVLDRLGADTQIVLVPPPGADKAQDVLPRDSDQIWVSWGTNSTTSRLCRYDLTGATPGNLAPTNTFGPDLMDHPRRITAPPGGAPTEIYLANRGTSEILRFDTTPGSEAFNVISDLQSGAIGPIGLSYDHATGLVWVVGDWGQSNTIGTFDPALNPSAPLTTVLSYAGGTVPGMEAPANCFLDRFRRLYVAGRSSNSGTPGIYIFDAETGTTLNFFTLFPTNGPAPVNIIDVELQPIEAEICGPVDGTGATIIQTGVLHDYRIRAPDFPSSFYVATMSLPWSGTLEPTLTLPAPDPRGLPYMCDLVFVLTTGVASFGGPSMWFGAPPGVPCPNLPLPGFDNALDIDLAINAFAGTLDSNGEALLQIQHLGIVAPFLEGIELDLGFVLIDPAVSNSIGLISSPKRLVFRTSPTSVTPLLCQ